MADVHVTTDAGVVALPEAGCTRTDLLSYVDSLRTWCALLNEFWIQIHISEQACDTLVSAGLFPSRHKLRELFQPHEELEYDANTISKLINKLLNAPSFESKFLEDVLYENLETVPSMDGLSNPHLQDNLNRSMILHALLCKFCSQPMCGHSLVLRTAPADVVKVKADILAIQKKGDDLGEQEGETFEGDVRVCDCFDKLIETIEESALLVSAQDDESIQLVLRLTLYKHFSREQISALDWADLPVPALGSEFRTTCQRICRDAGPALPPKILRAIVETVAGINLQDVHALRNQKAGGADQKMRDSDKAQRRDIDREFHLHYWECSNGKIELASVVCHNDFSIP